MKYAAPCGSLVETRGGASPIFKRPSGRFQRPGGTLRGLAQGSARSGRPSVRRAAGPPDARGPPCHGPLWRKGRRLVSVGGARVRGRGLAAKSLLGCHRTTADTNAQNFHRRQGTPGAFGLPSSTAAGRTRTKNGPLKSYGRTPCLNSTISRSAKDFQRLDADAAAGRLSKREFATKINEVEASRFGTTRAFYIHVFLPWAKEHGVATEPHLWYIPRESDTKDDYARSIGTEERPYWRHLEQIQPTWSWMRWSKSTKR